MKFKVREGFVVHHSKVIEIDLGGGETKKEIQTNTYYQGQNVDFTADEAEDHLHKLEPFDKEAQKAKKFPVVDKEKKTVTLYSGRQKMLCTFSIPDQYIGYPESTWDAGDEVRLTYRTPGQSLRFMNISKTDIFKK